MNPPVLKLAGCVMRNGAGDILLLHRSKNGVEQWELPGGKLEDGEDGEAAAIREIQEELGVPVVIIAFLGRADFRENERRHSYEWYEAEPSDSSCVPTICEPHTFNDLRHWKAENLRGRSDISANLKNLLESGVL
jgi:mutator protein MutT